MATDGL